MEPFSADPEPFFLPLSSTYSGKSKQTKGLSQLIGKQSVRYLVLHLRAMPYSHREAHTAPGTATQVFCSTSALIRAKNPKYNR